MSLVILDEIRKQSIWMILHERQKQLDKWGPQHHDPFIWLAILSEEVGEFSEALLHRHFGGPEKENVRKELVQIAAVALAMLEDIK